TDSNGHFTIPFGINFGPVLLVANGADASYRESATGLDVRWDSSTELRGVFLQTDPTAGISFDFPRGEKPSSVVLSPWSDLMWAYAEAEKIHKNEPFDAALRRSYELLNEHLESSFIEIIPADLTSPQVDNLNAEARAGALLGGLSWFVKRTATS